LPFFFFGLLAFLAPANMHPNLICYLSIYALVVISSMQTTIHVFYNYYAEGVICQARTNNKSRREEEKEAKHERR
jgi:hypothetical protein